MVDTVAVGVAVDLLVLLEDAVCVAGTHEVVVGGTALVTTSDRRTKLAAVVTVLQHS